MSRGVLFALSNLLGSLIVGILVAVGIEFLLVNYLFNGLLSYFNFQNIEFNILYILIISMFISEIFSKRNLTNFLFVSGYSRKNINTIKTVSTAIIVLIAFMVMVGSYFALNDMEVSIFADIDFIIYLISSLTWLVVFAEFGIYLNILYRRKSIKKAKGVNKKLYSYIYTIILVVCLYIFRGFYSIYIENGNLISVNNFRIISSVVNIIIFLILYNLNRKTILKLDIK